MSDAGRHGTGRIIIAVALIAAVTAVLVTFIVTHSGTTPSSSTSTTRVSTTTMATKPTTTTSTMPAATSTTGQPAASEVSVVLPLVACPTTYAGGTPTSQPPLPSTMAVSIPAALTKQLAVYSDAGGAMKLLAPTGWICTASFGVDGSGAVTVLPEGGSQPQGSFEVSQGEGVVGSETSACFGCREYQACALFSNAATDLSNDYHSACSETRPPAELVDAISTTVMGFLDPPGVAGDGDPSGGSYPANGVMTYARDNEGGSWLDTCTLPATQQVLCTAALNTFVDWYGGN